MNILHLLISGNTGGIEVLCKEISILSKKKNVFCFLKEGGSIEKEIRDNGGTTYVLGSSDKILFRSTRCRILNICRNEKIDKVVTHNLSPILWTACRYMHKTCQIPYIIYVHENFKNINSGTCFIQNFYRKTVFKYASNSALKIVGISQFVEKSVLELFPGLSKKTVLNYNGVNEVTTIDLSEQRNNGDKVVLIFIGRLVKDKGVDVLIDALSLLKNSIDFNCNIIGDGPEKESLQRKVSNYGLSNQVFFRGHQRNVNNWHEKSDIFVHPARCEEGFGISIVEAMASGLPCISVNKGAIGEIITDGWNGYIVENLNMEELAGAIVKAINAIKYDHDLWAQMKSNSRTTASVFCIKKTVEQFDNIT